MATQKKMRTRTKNLLSWTSHFEKKITVWKEALKLKLLKIWEFYPCTILLLNEIGEVKLFHWRYHNIVEVVKFWFKNREIMNFLERSIEIPWKVERK